MRRFTYANVAATAAVLLAFGAGGFAVAQSGSSGTLVACAKKKGGKLRAVSSASKCKRKRERVIRWNAAGRVGPTGPAGAAGAAGAAGQPGPTGPAGSSHLYARHVETNVAMGTTLAKKASYTLPAGKYLLTSKLTVFNNDLQPSGLSCVLEAGATTVDEAEVTIPARGGGADYIYDTLTLTGVADLAERTLVQLKCGLLKGATLDGVTQAYDVRIEAVRVGDITLEETFSGE